MDQVEIDSLNATMQKNTKRIKENVQQIYSYGRNEVLSATRQLIQGASLPFKYVSNLHYSLS